MKPLENILVLDLSQFLSGPSATLRLADLGARVIKIEKPLTGDICRQHYVSNVVLNGESSIFRAINRNKESFQSDLKVIEDRKLVLKLIEKADVVVHNFRPGVIERLGMDYTTIQKINPQIVYGEISGYGVEGPWKSKPGQDLLVQSVSGLTGLSGTAGGGPVPVGLALIDILTGAHLVQGILAALLKRAKTGLGTKISVSMLESSIDFQFESITTFYHDGGQPIVRPKNNSAHAFLGAPYGVYKTENGYLSLAMGSVPFLGELLNCEALLVYKDPANWFDKRDEIKQILAEHLKLDSTEHWLSILEPADIWCAKVMNWKDLMDEEGFQILAMIQKVTSKDDFEYQTTRCPIRIDGEVFTSRLGSPGLGEHTENILEEFDLEKSE